MTNATNSAGAQFRVLITGGFGNLGSHAVRACLDSGFDVRVFDMPNKRTKQVAKSFRGQHLTISWGDITTVDVDELVTDVDAVIHTAFVLWPVSEHNPVLAQRVNVGGTRRLLEACARREPYPRFVFASSIAVFGYTHDLRPPRTSADPTNATDEYSRTKIEAEELVRSAGLPFVVARVSVAPPLRAEQMSRELLTQLFAIRPDNRVEFVHPEDVGLALTRATVEPEAAGKVLLIGGGVENRVTQLDFENGLFEASGLGNFPPEVFGQQPMYTDWLDTEESQRILRYQYRSFDEFLNEFAAELGAPAKLIKPVAPLVRYLLVRIFSPQPR